MFSQPSRLSPATRRNWWLDFAVFLGATLAMISGIYFLYLPVGGYQGGRNPTYGITILFERHTWEDVHLWGGLLMIAAVVVHVWIHRAWIAMIGRKLTPSSRGRMSKGAKINVLVDAVIALSFLLAALSGLFFLFQPASGVFIFERVTWDLIHTWSGVALTLAAVIHLYIHWGWVTKVTGKMLPRLPHKARGLEPVPVRQAS